LSRSPDALRPALGLVAPYGNGVAEELCVLLVLPALVVGIHCLVSALVELGVRAGQSPDEAAPDVTLEPRDGLVESVVRLGVVILDALDQLLHVSQPLGVHALGLTPLRLLAPPRPHHQRGDSGCQHHGSGNPNYNLHVHPSSCLGRTCKHNFNINTFKNQYSKILLKLIAI
jgi:hypothetical protein